MVINSWEMLHASNIIVQMEELPKKKDLVPNIANDHEKEREPLLSLPPSVQLSDSSDFPCVGEGKLALGSVQCAIT